MGENAIRMQETVKSSNLQLQIKCRLIFLLKQKIKKKLQNSDKLMLQKKTEIRKPTNNKGVMKNREKKASNTH